MLNFFNAGLNILINFDDYLVTIVRDYGPLTYLLLFIIVFCETGLVLTPFLPGDSLVFIAGTLAAVNSLNVYILAFVFFAAAIIGDSVNYYIGNYFGERVFAKSRFFKPEYLERTKEFYHKHGSKTIVLARFVPIVRTFAPFVAGVANMEYKKFFFYNVLGAFIWTVIFLFAGYFFGQAQFVKDNLTLVTVIIIFISLLPVLIEYLRHKLKRD
jgi:membrane-associated protein